MLAFVVFVSVFPSQKIGCKNVSEMMSVCFHFVVFCFICLRILVHLCRAYRRRQKVGHWATVNKKDVTTLLHVT